MSNGVNGSFLQSKEWEEIQRVYGRRTWRIQDILLVEQDLPFGFHYLYAPRPDFGDKNNVVADVSRAISPDPDQFLKEAIYLGKKEGNIFLKIDQVSDISFSQKPYAYTAPLQPAKTVIVDLSRSKENLLSSLHPKTRYNIRLAERHGVVVEESSNLSEFLALLKATSVRDHFLPHSDRYYEALASVRSPKFFNAIFLARFEKTPLAGAMVNFFEDMRGVRTATYLHGASASTMRNVMAPHLLHWKIMRYAQEKGYQWYDFWGIDEKRRPGITRFKKGFGGFEKEFAPSVEFPCRKGVYSLYNFMRTMR